MSARMKFVPGGKSPIGQSGDNVTTESGIQPSSDNHDSSALKDASNSPRPGRKAMRGNTPNNIKNSTGADTINTASIQPPASALTMAGANNPLNTAYLIGSKANKSGGTPNQNKKERNISIDRLKENDPLSRIRSPKPIPMSARQLQNSGPPVHYLFNPANAPLLTDDQGVASLPNQRQPSRLSDGPRAHMPVDGQRTSHSPVNLTRNSFATSGHTLMNSFSPSSTRSYNESLEPAKREVFPMRPATEESIEEMHTFNSLSPPEPAQRFFPEKRAYDYQAPINPDEPDAEVDVSAMRKQDQRVLRRTTKRIGRDGIEDEAMNMREGKRTKLDMHSKEVMMEQHIDLTYDHSARPERSSTPAPRYTTPVHDPYSRRQPTPHPHHEMHVSQNHDIMQYGEENQALCRLLGIDFDHYFAEHIEQYEAAKKRWTSCSVEEWKTGAEEISAKFNKLIDFVKERMTAKLSLYASLHDKVAHHKVTLGERKSMLKNMQEQLVKDSGTVLGGAMNGAG
ncbi:hypothetical protein ACEPAI_7058 [Sanghuangporus weigelae]